MGIGNLLLSVLHHIVKKYLENVWFSIPLHWANGRQCYKLTRLEPELRQELDTKQA